ERSALGDRVYGWDIGQDGWPWNDGVRKRRSGPETDEGHVDLVEWLSRDGRELVDEYARLYVPRNDPRWLRRNAIVALGNVGGPDALPVLAGVVDEHAAWAIERIESRA